MRLKNVKEFMMESDSYMPKWVSDGDGDDG